MKHTFLFKRYKLVVGIWILGLLFVLLMISLPRPMYRSTATISVLDEAALHYLLSPTLMQRSLQELKMLEKREFEPYIWGYFRQFQYQQNRATRNALFLKEARSRLMVTPVEDKTYKMMFSSVFPIISTAVLNRLLKTTSQQHSLIIVSKPTQPKMPEYNTAWIYDVLRYGVPVSLLIALFIGWVVHRLQERSCFLPSNPTVISHT